LESRGIALALLCLLADILPPHHDEKVVRRESDATGTSSIETRKSPVATTRETEHTGARDRDLVEMVASGSAAALAELYDRHVSRVFALATRVLRRDDAAEEVVQDVFCQVWTQTSSYSTERGTVALWIVSITRRLAIERLRPGDPTPSRSITVSTSARVQPPTSDADHEASMAAINETSRIRSAVDALPAAHRVLVDLAYYEGLTCNQMAARIGIPSGAVKTSLRLAMQQLRQALL
jgi:RNA polymerase sigma-70 factor (ECF subfamily)